MSVDRSPAVAACADRRRATPCTAGLVLLLTLLPVLAGCQWWRKPARSATPAQLVEPLAPSPRLILGRIVAIDPERRFAFVELAPDAPAAALAEGSDLIVRNEELRETARLRTSRYVRGRTLGTTIANGQPLPGQEVVWLAP